MPPKRSSAPMSRADLVRNLWAEFESWHTEQLALLDERITKALRELDQNRKPAGGGKKKGKSKDKEKDADHEKKKADTRKELEKSFDGNKVRQEWQKRLEKAGLFDYDWHDMTQNEQKKVEKILGVDLDLNEGDVTIIETAPPPPPPASTQRTSPSSLATSPMSNSSRLDVMSEPYAFVDPASFRAAEAVAEEIPFDNWLEVRQRHKSDDEVSLDASTTSSWAGGTDVPAYLAWSSEISRSSAQSSQTSLTGSPERFASKLPVAEPFHSNLVSSAVHRLALFGDGPRDSGVSNIKKPADTTRSEFMPAMHTSFRPTDRTAVDPQMSSSSSTSTKRSKQHYIGPELLDVDYDESVEAEQFREFKMSVRIEMIREFHQDAAEADIQLALTIEQANHSGAVSKGMTAQLVEDHERNMLKLRQSKEKERKERVEQERQRRLAEFRQWTKQKQKPVSQPVSQPQPPPPPPPATTSHEHSSLPSSGIDPKILTERFLRELQNGPEAARAPFNAVSDTPTIRSQMNRMRLPNIQDWLAGSSNDSGTDTPTPTIQSSGWKFKETPAPTSTLTDAPSFKRLPSGLAKSVSVDSTSSQLSEDVPSTEPESSTSEFSKTSKGASTSSSKKGAKSKAESTKKKEKAPAAASQTEGASSSKAEQTAPKLQSHGSATKVEKSAAPASKSNVVPHSATSPTAILPPPPVPRSTRPDIPATPIPLYAFAQPNLDQFPQAFPSSQAPPVSVQPPPHLQTPAFSPPQTLAASNHPPAPSHLHTPAFQSLQAPLPPSTSQQPPPPSLHMPSLAATDSHQRWVPPTTKSEEKRPQPSRTVTEPPSKIKKSNTTQSTILPPPPAQADSSKRSRRVSDPVMPGSFDYPNAKAPSQAPAQSSAKPNNPPSGILKKAGASTSNGSTKTTSKSSGKAKKVTIEEVKDEEEEEESKFEHLPSDSGHIMEPKPVVAQAMFSPIIDFSGEDELKDRRAVVEKKALAAAPPPPAQIRRQESETSSASAFAPRSNQIWIPPQSSMAEARSVGNSSSRMPGQLEQGGSSSERHIRWTANTTAIEDDGGERFLHGLNEVMKAVEKKESAGAPPPKTDWSQTDMPRMSSMAENGRVGAGRSAASQSGVFWNPNVTTNRKPLTTSS
ncbi:hypothetical protein PM082_011719 [Marasmius tenuissimus]|nr:hypothetical protein PM082_011719 [Marasmius tenuissimus]